MTCLLLCILLSDSGHGGTLRRYGRCEEVEVYRHVQNFNGAETCYVRAYVCGHEVDRIEAARWPLETARGRLVIVVDGIVWTITCWKTVLAWSYDVPNPPSYDRDRRLMFALGTGEMNP